MGCEKSKLKEGPIDEEAIEEKPNSFDEEAIADKTNSFEEGIFNLLKLFFYYTVFE